MTPAAPAAALAGLVLAGPLLVAAQSVQDAQLVVENCAPREPTTVVENAKKYLRGFVESADDRKTREVDELIVKIDCLQDNSQIDRNMGALTRIARGGGDYSYGVNARNFATPRQHAAGAIARLRNQTARDTLHRIGIDGDVDTFYDVLDAILSFDEAAAISMAREKRLKTRGSDMWELRRVGDVLERADVNSPVYFFDTNDGDRLAR